MQLTSRQLAFHAARRMLDKGAEDLLVLELPAPQRVLFDLVVIATGRSERQVHTFVDEVHHFCKRHEIPHFPTEGEAGWMLCDLHDVVVHAFTAEARQRYNLERLWATAERLDHDAALRELPDPDLPPSI